MAGLRGLLLLAMLLPLPSCGARGSGADVAELLRLQALQQRAHLEKDAALLTSIFAEDFISVQDGAITRPSREESRARFQSYFDSVAFLAWEDITPPRIRLAADGTLAHVLVHKRVHLRALSDGSESETEFAWLETYERRDGEWKLTAVVSTRRPGGGDQGPGDPPGSIHVSPSRARASNQRGGSTVNGIRMDLTLRRRWGPR